MGAKLFISSVLLAVAFQAIDGAPVPQVTLTDVPGEALIGEDFTFKVTFQNIAGGTVGFGPFIDLVLDAGGANLKKACNTCDGISFVSAKVVGINGGPVAFATFPVSASCSATPVTAPLIHPFASSGIPPVTVPAGSQLVAIQLPFGSYDATQPQIVIEVTAHVSNFADDNVPVNISARGGFRYGTDALNNPSSDPPVLSDTNSSSSTWSAQKQTTPRVMVIKKECIAPEDETATGPNYPHTCTIKVDIANGQSIANLKVQDILANNVQYFGNVAVLIHATAATQGAACGGSGVDYVLTPPSAGPGGTLTVSFCNPIVGMPVPPDDVTIKFTFYVPDTDTNGVPVLSPNCTSALSVNKVHAEGDWTQTPPDPCDASPPPPLHVVNNVTATSSLSDKCLTIQKTVTDITASAFKPRPGDILRYVYKFQISDYKTIGKLVVKDFLADGQNILPGATLTVSDQFGTKPTVAFPAVAITSTPDPNGASHFCPHPVMPPFQAPPGGTVLTFDVSQAMGIIPPVIPRQNAGLLTGGYAAGPPLSNQPATGTVAFYVRIRDDFQFPVPTGADKYVDKDDPINNCIVMEGRVYQNVNRPNIPTMLTGNNATDDSTTHLTIATDVPKKTVYAVKRGNFFVCKPSGPVCSNFPNPPQEVRPGDQVTFRIQKTIPTSDAENLTIQDWLPLPIFDVSDPDANGSAGPNWNVGLIPACAPAPPGPGKVCRFTPSDTLGLPWSTGFPTLPTLVIGPSQIAANSIEFDYGTFNDPSNQPRKIDLLFTSTVTLQPFADGLFLTNEMQECEKNTFGDQFCQSAVAQVKLREPNLTIKKGVIATNNPNAVLSPAPTPAVRLKAFGTSCPRYNPTINHANLGTLFNSNVSNVDGNDWVTFAIAIENTGGVRAYDIQLDEIIPMNANDSGPSCFQPDYSTLCIRRGSGTSLPFTSHPQGHGRIVIDLTGTPLDPLTSITAVTGTNIIIITFNAQILPDIQPGCCDNRTDLLHYSSTPGGPDFVGAGFTPPFSDTATLCVNPTLTKSVVATSEAHTVPQTSAGSGIPNVAIGEIVRYRLATLLPEGGALSSVQVTDALPGGLKFLNDGTARLAFVSNGSGISHPLYPAAFNVSGNLPVTPTQSIPGPNISGGAGCGASVTFTLGNVQNNENDPDLEYVVIEFNALVCNVAGNVNSTSLPNTFSLSAGGSQISTSNAVYVVVVEPKLTISKTPAPAMVAQGGTVTYTVTITNTGTANAFDVQFADTLPAGLTFSPSSTTVTGGCSSTSSTTPAVTCGSVPVNGVVTVTYKAVANPSACPATLTNQAKVTWTSLPGPQGTVSNPTGSTTPLASATNNGERDGVTPSLTINNYLAATSTSVTVSCPSCLRNLPPGMVAWWPLDESNGATVVNDIALFNNQGVPKPGGALGGGGNPSSVSGQVAGALHFSPSAASYVDVSPSQTEIMFGAGNLSIDAWIRPVNVVQSTHIQAIVDKMQNNVGYSLYRRNQQLYFSIGDSSSLATYVSAPIITPNVWTHITVTVDRSHTGAPVTLYINGVQVALQAGSGPLPSGSTDNPASLWIGGSRLALSRDEISIDELEFFSRALTAGEIQQIFNAGPSGKCKCLMISNDNVTCNSDGTFSYTFTLKNLSAYPITGLTFSSGTSNLTITPNAMTVSLNPGSQMSITVTIGGSNAVSNTTVCFFVGSTGAPPAVNCSIQHCVALPKCQVPCASPPPHMVSWWPLNETSGSTVLDIGSAHNNGTTSSNIGADPTVDSAPKVGSALFFNASNATVSGSPYNFGTGSFSIDGWVRGSSHMAGVYMGIVDKLDSAPSPAGFAFFVGDVNNSLHLTMGNGTSSPVTFTSNPTFVYNQWQHVAVTVQRAGGSLVGTFYINGAQAGTTFTPPANSVNNTIPLLIGTYRPNAVIQVCLSCEVALDEIEIFDDVVSPSDIKTIFDAGSIGKCRQP